jgi:hypothetical protein
MGGGNVGMDGGFCMSLVANICSSPLVQPLVHSIAYGNRAAQVDLMKQFTRERNVIRSDNDIFLPMFSSAECLLT